MACRSNATQTNGNIFSKLSALIMAAITHKLMFTRLFCLIAVTVKEKFESLAVFLDLVL